jgi:hypothetical protein
MQLTNNGVLEMSTAKPRKVFICLSCKGVYADAPVTSCDCCPDKNEFLEGYIVIPKRFKVVKLPAWLQGNKDYNLNVGDMVERLDDTTIYFNKKQIRLAPSFTKDMA